MSSDRTCGSYPLLKINPVQSVCLEAERSKGNCRGKNKTSKTSKSDVEKMYFLLSATVQ